MGAGAYRHADPALPWMGASPAGPRPVTTDDAATVQACENVAALGLMRGYARSYFGPAGGIVLGVAGLAVGAVTGRARVALLGVGMAALAGLGTIETRRRAREWESMIDARIAAVTGARP